MKREMKGEGGKGDGERRERGKVGRGKGEKGGVEDDDTSERRIESEIGGE